MKIRENSNVVTLKVNKSLHSPAALNFPGSEAMHHSFMVLHVFKNLLRLSTALIKLLKLVNQDGPAVTRVFHRPSAGYKWRTREQDARGHSGSATTRNLTN